ncbi:MAG: SGNH/GDSL hydrolase family protein [Myxococcota bacterium]
MREALLLAVSAALSLLLGLLAVRWLAPGLLRSPSEVRIVQADERVVPFYENVFRPEDRASSEAILPDPTLVVRSRPFLEDRRQLGPTDALGFRNHAVPSRSRVVTIGDSQTYGTTVPIDDAWPHVLSRRLGDAAGVYDMSTGGWGAAQYLAMWEAAAFFEPEVVVVAFYAGNDPRDSFSAAYSIERFASLRPDAALGVDDLPPVTWPSPPEEVWALRFGGRNGQTVAFTPVLRLASNLDDPAVAAGWEVMARVAERILADAAQGGPQPLFTVIPTKERAFELRLRAAGAKPHAAYDALVAGEARYSAALVRRIEAAGGFVVDVAGPLRDAVRTSLAIYPPDTNGHMAPRGHALVAERMRGPVAALLD